MQLTKNFTLAELCATQTGLANEAPEHVAARLKALAVNVLQPVREHFGRRVTVNSGYRSPKVNEAVKGSKSSQHMFGYAADFEVPGVANGEVALFVRDCLDFDQLILEAYTPGKPSSGWVHCSFRGPRMNRRSVMTWTPRVGYRNGLII